MLCTICGESIRQWQRWSWDHVIPMSRGGRRGKSNKAPAHVLCNCIKGDRYPFAMKTTAERQYIKSRVSPQTWARLCMIWSGGED